MRRPVLLISTLAACVLLGSLPDTVPVAEARPRAKRARARRPVKRRIRKHHISLFNINTGERLNNLRLIREDKKDRSRKYIRKDARRRIRRFFRDRKTGKTRRIHDRLIWYLYIIGYHYDRPVGIVSGHRRKARKTSRHYTGRAADIRVDGVTPRALWRYCKRFKKVGLGLYPTSEFVHLDVRDRSYYWIDDSGPGEESRYRKGVAQPIAEIRAQRRRERARAAARSKKGGKGR